MGNSLLTGSVLFSAALLLLAGCAGLPGINSGNSSSGGAQQPLVSSIFNQTSNYLSAVTSGNNSSSGGAQQPVPPIFNQASNSTSAATSGNASSSEPGVPQSEENGSSSQGGQAGEGIVISPFSEHTLSEVAGHNSASDCWIIIYDEVYEMTSYIPSHPGGSALTQKCGQDATEEFESKPSGTLAGEPHSEAAWDIIVDYGIGPVIYESSSQPMLSEIAKHNSASDCWVVLDSSVINITGFTSSHRDANYSELNKGCGSDITASLEDELISWDILDELNLFYDGRELDPDVYLGDLSE